MTRSAKKILDLKVENWTYADFDKFSTRDDLSIYEKIGFPDEYRQGKEGLIFQDINQKISNLSKSAQTVFDIGAGCSELPIILSNHCEAQDSQLFLFDSENMLAQLPDFAMTRKVPGEFPISFEQTLHKMYNQVDAIICYSVIQYIFAGGNIWDFIDCCIECLAPNGEFLIGDIPNVSMRKRFFASEAGVRFHQEYTKTKELPEVTFNKLERGNIDDSVVFSILGRARSQGCQAWILPQKKELPMSNRREDILIKKP